MTILITGGTGKTGSRLARLLDSAKIPVLIASRSGRAPAPFQGVKFDWFDKSTYRNAFDARSDIDRVYLVLPPVFNPKPIAKSFIDFAISKGVKRFVLVSSSALDKGADGNGKVHEYLAECGADYVVLRPTWFIENFGTAYLAMIRDFDNIPTVTRDGRIAFVGVDDVANAAYNALVTRKSLKTDYYVLGPQLYSYDEAVALLSKVLGRKITHRRVSPEEYTTSTKRFGLPSDFASLLTSIGLQAASGRGEAIFTDRKAILGKKKLEDYFVANRELWVKK